MERGKILIIKDDAASAFALKDLLGELGFTVVGIAHSGNQAIEQTDSTHPDIILMDIHLRGDLDGLETSDMIRSKFDIPIIYLTSTSGEKTIRRAGSTSPFGYLFEPFDSKQILATIEVGLIRHRMEKRIRESHRWLNTTLTNISDGVIAVDEEFMIRFMNPSAAKLTGWAIDEVVGRPIHQVVTLFRASGDKTHVIHGIQLSPEIGQAHLSYQALLSTKTGEQVPVEVKIAPITDEKSPPMGVVLALRDITEQRKAMEEIELQAKRAEAMVNAAAQLNAQLDLKSVLNTICQLAIQALNASASRAYLYEPQEDRFLEMATRSNISSGIWVMDNEFPIPSSLVKSLISKENPVIAIRDVQALPGLPYNDMLEELNLHPMSVATLSRHGQMVGLLVVLTQGEPREATDDELMLLKGIADQAGIAIANARLFKQVQIGREHLQAISRRLVKVQEDERRFLARELHDQVGQTLTGLQFILGSGKRAPTSGVKARFEEASKIVSSLMSQIRELSINLWPSALDDMGLYPALDWLFERYHTHTGIRVDFEHNGSEERYPQDVEIAAYRIIQESLTNVARYAQTDQVQVSVCDAEKILELNIKDRGAGFDPDLVKGKNRSFGLDGMRERAFLLGGTLEINSSPGAGTEIKASLPLSGLLERRRYEREYPASR